MVSLRSLLHVCGVALLATMTCASSTSGQITTENVHIGDVSSKRGTHGHGTSVAGGGLLYYTPSTRHTVAFNERSFVIDGTPTLLLSGAVSAATR
jgi:hypothetical protein